MQSPVVEERIEEQQEPLCKHHWVIESPQGATSLGRCKLCGEAKEFRNSAVDTLWEGDPIGNAGKMSGGARRPVIAEATPSMREE
jgi:hypothetical protein